MTISALVTGGTGFIGAHLCSVLCARGVQVAVASTGASRPALPLPSSVERYVFDVRDDRALTACLAQVQPSVVFHLAGTTSIQRSWVDQTGAYSTNVLGTTLLLEALSRKHPGTRVVVVSSSAVYGSGHREPIVEDVCFAPVSPFGASKAGGELVAQVMARSRKLEVVVARPFAVIGPGKTGDALYDFIRGLLEVEKRARPYLTVGATDNVRDYVDVRDAASALDVIASRGESGTAYNVASGNGRIVGQLIEELERVAGTRIPIRHLRRRRHDVDWLVGDPARLLALGWTPSVPIHDTVRDSYEFWRSLEREPPRRGGGHTKGRRFEQQPT